MRGDSQLRLAADILAAYVEHNKVPAADLPNILRTINTALGAANAPPATDVVAPTLTAAQIRRSIRPDAITSFEDGKAYKQLKRHLTRRGLTPADYRAKWGLPADYPMVAPEYSEVRSALAKAAGLGQMRSLAKVKAEPGQPPTSTRIKGKLGLFGRTASKTAK